MSFEKFINKIAGEYPRFSIHERAARIVSFYTGLNFLIGMVFAILMKLGFRFVEFQILSALSFYLLYYLLTQKKYVQQVVVLCVCMLSVVFFIYWFYAGGLFGPALVSGLVIFYLALNVAPPQHKFLFGIYILCVIGVTFLLSYQHPNWITEYPKSNQDYFHYATLVLQFSGYYIFLEASTRYCYQYEQHLVNRQNRELGQANDAKLRLFAIISHDLRGPMATLKGILNSVDEGFSTPEKAQRQLLHLKTMTNPLNNTLNNLLLWSRQQLEGLHSAQELFAVGEILLEEISLAIEDAKSNQIQIDNRIPTETYVFADINQLRIVVRNLISNAVRYANKNTTVVLNHRATNGENIFIISNTGSSIPIHVVEEFNRTGKLEINDSHNKQKNRGLGLQICRDFVKIHGGNIWIDNSVTDKTVFCFSLPKNTNV